MLEGRLGVRLGEEIVEAGPGGGGGSAGIPHITGMPTRATRYLLAVPSRLMELIDDLNGGPVGYSAIFKKHASELL